MLFEKIPSYPAVSQVVHKHSKQPRIDKTIVCSHPFSSILKIRGYFKHPILLCLLPLPASPLDFISVLDGQNGLWKPVKKNTFQLLQLYHPHMFQS